MAELVGLGDLQDLHEEGLERIAKTATEGGQCVVIGVTVAGEIAESWVAISMRRLENTPVA